MSWFSHLSAICMCFSTRCRGKSFQQERESSVVQLIISYYSVQPDKSSFAFSLNHTTCDLRERNLTRGASQLTIFVNCEMAVCLCEETQLSQLIHFSLTARFLSVYVKKTNPIVNHFSLSTWFFGFVWHIMNFIVAGKELQGKSRFGELQITVRVNSGKNSYRRQHL